MTDPAMIKSGYEREDNDFYATPKWCTEALLRNVEFHGPIWEPAAGDGQMSAVLEAAGHQVVLSDINTRPPIVDRTECSDFLRSPTPFAWPI